MKYILTGTFMCLLLISSCTCNDNPKVEDETGMVDSMNAADADNTADENSMKNIPMNDVMSQKDVIDKNIPTVIYCEIADNASALCAP